MKQAFDRFILAIPVLFIKQFPYAWIAAVASWSWPPVLSAIFLVIVVIGLLMLRWQSKAWISNLRREHAFKDGRFYVDLPSFSGITAVKRILLLLAGAALIALLLKGSFGLTFWKIFVIVMGFTILYRDTQFFGAETTYVVTDQGIGIRFVQVMSIIVYSFFSRRSAALKKVNIKRIKIGISLRGRVNQKMAY